MTMNRLLPLLAVFIAAVVTGGLSKLEAKTKATYYLAIRTDGKRGSGLTSNDPINCSTESRFDGLLRRLGTNVNLIFGPGVYQTLGFPTVTAKSGWSWEGAGEGVTIIQNVAKIAYVSMFTSNGPAIDHVTIRHMTWDANAGILKLSAHPVTQVLATNCSNTWIDHVEIKNAYGDSQGREEFSILLGTGPGNSVTHCVVHRYIAPVSDTTPNTNGFYVNGTHARIVDCLDDGSAHAYGMGSGKDLLIEGCKSTSLSENGYYIDTGDCNNLTLLNNYFAGTGTPIMFNGNGVSNGVRIIDNSLYTYGTGNVAIHFCTASAGSHFLITGNRYYNRGSASSPMFIYNQSGYTALDVTSNRIPANASLGVPAPSSSFKH
jgi:hypothetical protein